MNKKKISIVTPCYNEELNVRQIFEAVREIMAEYAENYDYEHIFIDNGSQDATVALLREMAEKEPRLKVILNMRNYGFLNSQFYGILQAGGDAVIPIVADFQDPPEMIREFIARWEEGKQIVIAVKRKSKENFCIYAMRCLYYSIMKRMADTKQIKNFIGYGLYDKQVVAILRDFSGPMPYLRGMIAEIGLPIHQIPFVQPIRQRGKTNFNFFRLYDAAMIGLVNYTSLPLRLATFTGCIIALCSLLVGFYTLIYKLLHWDTFSPGIASLAVGMFFLSAVQLIFLGILGEFVRAVLIHVKNRPIVLEKERINFDLADTREP